MKIILSAISPIGCADDLPPSVNGDCLTYRGLNYDFGPLLNGAEINIGLPFTQPVTRQNDQIVVQLEYLYSSETSVPAQSTDWADFTFDIESGQCHCPILRRPEPAEPLDHGGE